MAAVAFSAGGGGGGDGEGDGDGTGNHGGLIIGKVVGVGGSGGGSDGDGGDYGDGDGTGRGIHGPINANGVGQSDGEREGDGDGTGSGNLAGDVGRILAGVGSHEAAGGGGSVVPHFGDEMPDPNGDGHGSPISNVAFGGAVSEAAAVSSDSVQSHGAEAGIIIVGGNSASPDGGSFWDQAASHADSEAAVGVSSAAGLIASATVHAAIETSTTSAHDFSSVVLDHGAATHVSVVAVHGDFTSMAHYETPSLSGGEFATHLYI